MLSGLAVAEVDVPKFDESAPVAISADAGNCWEQGAYEVWLLRGNCRLAQGDGVAQSREAVVWIQRAEPMDDRPTKVIAYFEGKVTLAHGAEGPKLEDKAWFGRFQTRRDVSIRAAQVAGKPDVTPAVYRRGESQFQPGPPPAIMQTQFVDAAGMAPTIVSPQAGPPAAGTRRIRAFPRSNQDVQINWYPDPQGNNQWIGVVTSGATVIVDGLPEFGSIDVSADRVVIWINSAETPDLDSQGARDARVPLELYLEGNIVFRQGERTVYAERMYYDVTNQVGTVLAAEMLTPVEGYEGLLRLRAEVVQQVGEGRFFAKNAFITSSRLGFPSYRLQAGDITFTDVQRSAVDPLTGQPLVKPGGEPVVDHDQSVVARNNVAYIDEVPFFYWPVFATDLQEPSFYVRRIRLKNDSVFGTQVLTDFDAYELLGIKERPAGTRWDISLDYMSKQGLGHGTTFLYHPETLFGMPAPGKGLLDYWGIYDTGRDDLGEGRRDLVPEEDYRYRLLWQHRQRFGEGYQLTGEVGWISDRNFLEQYFEQEWDELKDQSTRVTLEQLMGNQSWSIMGDLRLNKFVTNTEWLPRLDHYWLGQSLFDTFTWYEHSNLAYTRFNRASAPSNPADQPFTFLPWESTPEVEGERFATRQEIDLPIQLGPVKVVPYVLGEFAHWGQDINGDDLNRTYGQAGIRTSLPIWRADPMIESQFWNVHGLAHKMDFQFEFLVADASAGFDQLPLYDPLDDDSIEAFRRRFATNTFDVLSPVPAVVGGVPQRFDERYYALRYGLARYVTSPSTEIADDLMAMRLGLNQRWQTKRGLPGQRRIIDWITLDTNMTVFPEEDRDNYGKFVGLWDYNFRWHLGDRTTVVSDGIFDFFEEGQQIATVGMFITRPPRGSLYLGFRVLEGPIRNHILSTSYSYLMSPKWISTFGMTIDLAEQGNLGQNFTITRIGESLLVSAGITVDPARGDWGFGFTVEPRFLPKGKLGGLTGARIPPAGAYGLE